MSSFVKDTILIDKQLKTPVEKLDIEQLQAVFLPYYNDPESLELTVVLQRSIMPGTFNVINKRMGLSALTVDLPVETPLTIEQAFSRLNLNTSIEHSIPFGSVMPFPESSTKMYELVLVNIEPLALIDKNRGIFYQEKGKFEIGVVYFRDLIDAMQNNIMLDLKTRLLLNELYIIALEENAKNLNPNNMMSGNKNMIGGGSNLPSGYLDKVDTMKTGNVSEQVLKQNTQMDFGAIYKNSKNEFQTIN